MSVSSGLYVGVVVNAGVGDEGATNAVRRTNATASVRNTRAMLQMRTAAAVPVWVICRALLAILRPQNTAR